MTICVGLELFQFLQHAPMTEMCFNCNPHLIMLTFSLGYITDDIALHVIRPLTDTAVSLHLYSYPIAECNIYDCGTGVVTRRRLGFYTEFGKVVCTGAQQAPPPDPGCRALRNNA